MVLIVAIGDLHFKKDTPAMTDLVISKITEQIVKIRPDIVVLLGDILDTMEKIDMKTQNKAVKFIKHMASLKSNADEFINVVVVIGNHERPDSTNFLTEDSSFYALKGFPNIHIADRVLSMNWETVGVKEKMRFVFVPYVAPGEFHRALDTLEDKVMDPKCTPYTIFCHQEFRGVQIGRYKSKEGDEWPLENPLIISGHIHTRQQVQPNIFYPGTPYQISFHDNTDKVFVIAEYAVGKSPNVNIVPLDIRRKRIITLTPAEVDSFVPPPNCDVQVDIVGSNAEIKALNATGLIPKMRSRGVSVSLSTKSDKNPLNPENKPFRELLMDMIKDDFMAINIFNRIFAPQQSQSTSKLISPEIGNLSELMKSVQLVTASNTAKTLDTSSLLASMLPGNRVGSAAPLNIGQPINVGQQTGNNNNFQNQPAPDLAALFGTSFGQPVAAAPLSQLERARPSEPMQIHMQTIPVAEQPPVVFQGGFQGSAFQTTGFGGLAGLPVLNPVSPVLHPVNLDNNNEMLTPAALRMPSSSFVNNPLPPKVVEPTLSNQDLISSLQASAIEKNNPPVSGLLAMVNASKF
jgi:DNA repair exonuclease SbcCD nuclease subunit